jgi:hypothetical protein
LFFLSGPFHEAPIKTPMEDMLREAGFTTAQVKTEKFIQVSYAQK